VGLPVDDLVMSKNRSITTLDLYCGLMEEIKIRVKNIQLFLTGHVLPPFPGAIAREHCFCQLRMICETLAIGCLVIHNQTSEVKAFEKLWNAKDIMDRLEVLNPFSFPKPVRITRYPDGAPIGFDVIPITPPSLTKDSFLTLYGRCGDALHRGHLRKIATNIPLAPVSLQEIGEAVNNVMNLLRAHQISSADYTHHFICVMENTPGGKCAIVTSLADSNVSPKPSASLK
jgi:hypothetical protein